MPYLNLDIITDAARLMNSLGEVDQPTAEQGVIWLDAWNDLMADWAKDGLHLGWFPQTDLSAQAPVRDEDVRGIKLCLAGELASRNGMSLKPELSANIDSAYAKLVKRSIRYVESDLSELPRAQGIFNGIWY